MSGKKKRKSVGRRSGTDRVAIVVADDDLIVLDQICNLLERRFDVIGKAANGRELLAVLERCCPAVAVVDIAMPEMNGIEAARLIAKNHPAVKVVLLTGHHDPEIIDAAFEAGALGYVSKFAAYAELIPAIDAALDGRVYRSNF